MPCWVLCLDTSTQDGRDARASPHHQPKAIHPPGPFPVLCLLLTAPSMGGLQWLGQAGSPVINGWSRLHTAELKNNSDEA